MLLLRAMLIFPSYSVKFSLTFSSLRNSSSEQASSITGTKPLSMNTMKRGNRFIIAIQKGRNRNLVFVLWDRLLKYI